MCPPFSSLGLIIVSRHSQAALNILKNYKRSKTQLQDLSSKLINEIMFRPFSELFAGCPSQHVSSISCQHFHSFFSDTAPVYLSDLLGVYSPSRQLRCSSDSKTLRIPPTKTKTSGHRSFSSVAPSFWISLPCEFRHIPSTTEFQTALKIHLFKSYLC